MSQNYRETTVAGTEYLRCRSVHIINEKDRVPVVAFGQELVTILPGRTVFEGAGELRVDFDPNKTINVINPLTGEPTGQSMTYGEVYAVLYSAWLQEAQARDAAVGA